MGSLAIASYAWATAVNFGIAWLDITYARLAPQAATAFSEVADLLLLQGAITVLLALVAIGLSWNSKRARDYLAASLAITLLALFAPAFLSPVLPAGSAWGAAIRLAVGAAVSAAAFMAFHKFRLDQ